MVNSVECYSAIALQPLPPRPAVISGPVQRPIEKQGVSSRKTPTDPWNIPQTLNYLLMMEILSYLYFGIPGVCSRDLLDFS